MSALPVQGHQCGRSSVSASAPPCQAREARNHGAASQRLRSLRVLDALLLIRAAQPTVPAPGAASTARGVSNAANHNASRAPGATVLPSALSSGTGELASTPKPITVQALAINSEASVRGSPALS